MVVIVWSVVCANAASTPKLRVFLKSRTEMPPDGRNSARAGALPPATGRRVSGGDAGVLKKA
jgi:hypothetical protein